MIELVLPFIIFPIALFTRIRTADIFVNNAEILGKKFGIPHFVIGITVIAIGTSLPELATSVVSILRSTSENDLTPIIPANVVGSNIANILLGVGIASLFRAVKVKKELIDTDLPFLFGSTAMLCFFLYDGALSRIEGFLLLATFVIFILYSISGNHGENNQKIETKEKTWVVILWLIISALGIGVSSDFTISSLEDIAITIGIPSSIASMVFLAVGTSFPEIFVTVMMTRKKLYCMAVGNILGSNISNTLGILGISGLMANLTVAQDTIYIGLPFIIVSSLYFIFAGMDRDFNKWEGMMAIMIFLVFLGKIFNIT